MKERIYTMKDRYLFRGKADGEWYIGNLFISKQTNHHVIISDAPGLNWEADTGIDSHLCQTMEVDPITVGQCTGLKDEHGKLVFEGDVVKTVTNVYGLMVWEPAHFAIKWVRFEDSKSVTGTLFEKPIAIHHYFNDVDAGECKIIGNIHDAPELLEVIQDKI